MKSLIAGVLLTFSVAATPTIPSFPFRTYAEVPITSIDMPGGACGLDDGVALRSGDWRIISGKSRDVFLHIGKDDEYDFIYFTVGSAGGPITVRLALTIDQARVQFPSGPCSWLLSVDTSG